MIMMTWRHECNLEWFIKFYLFLTCFYKVGAPEIGDSTFRCKNTKLRDPNSATDTLLHFKEDIFSLFWEKCISTLNPEAWWQCFNLTKQLSCNIINASACFSENIKQVLVVFSKVFIVFICSQGRTEAWPW